jgi:taurine dioxygenase
MHERLGARHHQERDVEFLAVTGVLGAEVLGVDLCEPLSDANADRLYQGLTQYQVLFFRDQSFTPQSHLALANALGEIEPAHPVYPHVEGFESIVELIADADNPPDTEDWHKDLTFRATPPFASILRAVSVPSVGGDTLWASMSAVYEALSDGWKADLAPLLAVHDMGTFRNDYYQRGGVNEINRALSEVGSAVHPVVEIHPVSGLKYLNVNQSFTRQILNMTQGPSDEILQYLYQQVRKPEFQVRLRWQDDTVAIWDNRVTQHYAVCDYLPNRRHMQRVTVNRDKRAPPPQDAVDVGRDRN